jgi:hypothetical protein
MFLNGFNLLMLKIILKNKKNYFDIFLSKKHFEQQLHFQTDPEALFVFVFKNAFEKI